MTVVFRFDAPDPNLRGSIVLGSIDSAVSHVCNVMNGADVAEGRKWTIDEEGEEVPQPDWLRTELQNRSTVTLHDQSSIGTLETVEICVA